MVQAAERVFTQAGTNLIRLPLKPPQKAIQKEYLQTKLGTVLKKLLKPGFHRDDGGEVASFTLKELNTQIVAKHGPSVAPEIEAYLASPSSPFRGIVAKWILADRNSNLLVLHDYSHEWDTEFATVRDITRDGRVSSKQLLGVLDAFASAELEAFTTWKPGWSDRLLSHEMDEWENETRFQALLAAKVLADAIAPGIPAGKMLHANIIVNGEDLGSIGKLIETIDTVHAKNKQRITDITSDSSTNPDLLIIRAGDSDMGQKNMFARVVNGEIRQFLKIDLEKMGRRVVVGEALAILLKAVSSATTKVHQLIPNYTKQGEISLDVDCDIAPLALEWEARAWNTWVAKAAANLGSVIFEQTAIASAWNHLHAFAYEGQMISLVFALKRLKQYNMLRAQRLGYGKQSLQNEVSLELAA